MTKALSDENIRKINDISKTQKVIVTLPNTCGLTIGSLKKLNPNITISIQGGLNPSKRKFNNEYYQKRTYYTPSELILIIQKFESIERKINPLWSELEKVMFVYKSLCESFTYFENEFNNRDASRNLLGMITNQSVCSGFAMIFKEAMDRIGIECIYQNKKGHHSWNICKIDGKYYAIELTWDTSSKTDNRCGFKYFCRETKQQFYSNPHHNIDDENEEFKYEIENISLEKISQTLKNITMPKIIIQKLDVTNGIYLKNNIPFVKLHEISTYIRNDGTSFIVRPTGKRDKGVMEYAYIEYKSDDRNLLITYIYSEMDLITTDQLVRNNIANNLLSKERVTNKINNFNGYVGYVTKGSRSRYSNQNFEENVIHKFR